MKNHIIILMTVILVNCISLSCFAACPSADLTGDCFVDFMDMYALATQWLSGTPSACATSDLTEDCYVDFNDFTILAEQWQKYPDFFAGTHNLVGKYEDNITDPPFSWDSDSLVITFERTAADRFNAVGLPFAFRQEDEHFAILDPRPVNDGYGYHLIWCLVSNGSTGAIGFYGQEYYNPLDISVCLYMWSDYTPLSFTAQDVTGTWTATVAFISTSSTGTTAYSHKECSLTISNAGGSNVLVNDNAGTQFTLPLSEMIYDGTSVSFSHCLNSNWDIVIGSFNKRM
jgi:hypothetical protein